MYGLLFVVLFAANVAIAIYLAVDAKSHARPWRMFAAGFISIIVAYGFEQSAQALNLVGVSTDDIGLQHLVKLTNIICGAMAGALIGTAITNRANMLHTKEMSALMNLRNTHSIESERLLNELKDALDFKTNDPGDLALNRTRVKAIERLVYKTMDAKNKLDAQISRIAP